MALHFIIGGTSCGKSERICELLSEQSMAFPQKRFIAIVPEQATLLMQKNLIAVHPKKVITNIDIVSFGFLAQMVFSELGKDTMDVLDDTGKALVLKKLLAEIKEDLIVYGRKARMPGFTEEVKSMITEFKQYDVDDNELFLMQEAVAEQGSRLLYSKLQDLRLIYRKFNDAIAERYTTAEELLDIFARLVPESAILRDAEIFLDGFTGFTPVQYKLIGRLLETAANVTMTVTLPSERMQETCPDYDLFYLSNRTLSKMKELAQQAGIRVDMTECLKDPQRAAQKTDTVKIYAAPSITQEVGFAASKILELVKSGTHRFRDIALVVSDMETYYRSIQTAFDEAEISYFIDHKNRLSQNALAHFLLSALRLFGERFSYDSLFSYLKTGLSLLDADEVARLENYCLEFGIRGFKAFRSDFYKNREKKEKWDLDEINALRKKVLESVEEFYISLKSGNNPADRYCDALLKLFEANGTEAKIRHMAEQFTVQGDLALAEEYEQLFEQVSGLLLKIRTLSGQELLTAAEYAELLAQGLEEIKVGVIPPSLDAVVVGDLTRTRIDRIKTLFLLGANEGKLPNDSSGANTIFTGKERELLKKNHFEIAPTVLENIYTQRFYLHLMLSKPEEHLWITYTQVAFDGSSLSPSYLLEDLPELLPGMHTETEDGSMHVTWEAERFRKLARTITEPDEGLLNYFAREHPHKLRQILAGAFFTNRQQALDAQIAGKLYGDRLSGSVSRYEKFAECPFKHFLQYGLRIEKRPEYEVKATDIGTIYHDSLEKYAMKLAENGQTFREISDEDSKRLIRQSVEEAVAGLGSDVMESTARNEFLMKRIVKVAEKTTDVLRKQVKDGKYEPAFFEKEFEIRTDEAVSFKGKIDRVDLYDGGDVFVKVIDYKSGSKEFDITDIYSGLQLQLVTYLNEAVKLARMQYPDKEVQPGGIYYYLINDKFVRDEEEAEKKFTMSGLTNCAPEALEAIDTTVGFDRPGSSRIVEIKYGKNGLLSGSKVANGEEFFNLLKFVNQKIAGIGQEIKAGNVQIAPFYRSASRSACSFCDYSDVCKFEDGSYGTCFRRDAEEVTKAQMEKELFGRADDRTDRKKEE